MVLGPEGRPSLCLERPTEIRRTLVHPVCLGYLSVWEGERGRGSQRKFHGRDRVSGKDEDEKPGGGKDEEE